MSSSFASLVPLYVSNFLFTFPFSYFQSGKSLMRDGSTADQILESLGSLAAVDLDRQIQDSHFSGRDKFAIQVSYFVLMSFVFGLSVLVSSFCFVD